MDIEIANEALLKRMVSIVNVSYLINLQNLIHILIYLEKKSVRSFKAAEIRLTRRRSFQISWALEGPPRNPSWILSSAVQWLYQQQSPRDEPTSEREETSANKQGEPVILASVNVHSIFIPQVKVAVSRWKILLEQREAPIKWKEERHDDQNEEEVRVSIASKKEWVKLTRLERQREWHLLGQ
jgi:hypothetical protein